MCIRDSNYSDESVQIGVAQFDASGNPIDLQLTAGTGTQSLPNPGQQTASAVTVVDYTSAGMPPAPDTLYLFVADSQSSTLNVYQASGAPAPVSYTHLDVYKRQRPDSWPVP